MMKVTASYREDLMIRDGRMEDVPALEGVKAPAVVHEDRIKDAVDGDFRYLVMETDSGEVIGHACLVFRRPRTWPQEKHQTPYPRVIDLLIREDRRGRGLGQIFLRQMEAICTQRGLSRLYLSVDPEDNADALRFYARQGYMSLDEKPQWREWSFRDSQGCLHHGAGWDVELYKDLQSSDPVTAHKEMTEERVEWFLALFDELEVTVWLDGGWCVDALLGVQTRPHNDLDIVIPSADSGRLVEALCQRGFQDVIDDDRCDWNFVMRHPEHGLIDFHVVEKDSDGGAVYGPGELDWEISAPELSGRGSIAGRAVRCLSVEYEVRSHSGYRLQHTDFTDMKALQDRFGVSLLDGQIKEEP